MGALTNGNPVRLYATCHDQHWNATELEPEQIREYLGAIWPGKHRQKTTASFAPEYQVRPRDAQF